MVNEKSHSRFENGSNIFIPADIPFSRRCLKETEQNNTKNDNQPVHIQLFSLQM